jgi:hypothetical protein
MKFVTSLFLAILGVQISLATFTTQVEPKTTDCFHVDAKAGEKVHVVFFVTRGGLLDIDLRVGIRRTTIGIITLSDSRT